MFVKYNNIRYKSAVTARSTTVGESVDGAGLWSVSTDTVPVEKSGYRTVQTVATEGSVWNS